MREMPSPDDLSPKQSAEALSHCSERDFFRELGVRTFINAAGTYTLLSASLMLPEVVAAMSYAAKHFVEIDELQAAAGERIAELLGCEAAMVTSGAAAALTIGTAACLTGDDPVYVHQVPDLTGLKSEVIIQRSHRFLYDHAIRNCGIKFVEIETVAELENAISGNTAMMDQDTLKVSADEIRQQLRDGRVSIEAVPTYSYEPSANAEEIRFGVWMMQPNEAEIVAQRLREVFRQAVHISSQTEKNG